MKSWFTAICLISLVLQAVLVFAAPIGHSVRIPNRSSQRFPTSPPQTGSGNGDVQKMLELVNRQRQLNGKTALKLDNRLVLSAQKHTDYQARVGQMTHDEPGRPLSTRVSETGFKWRALGENVAKGYGSIDAVMKGWMNSPGHRSNILSSQYTHFGSGYVAKGNYWTQNFARQA
ncbi:SCP-domain-containing protein [Basidiobolus meristosporus CBS 931.73]|uniref:SCP-domain-containing protein n=1 Tax=Basidiobolus meristosporus CBS 931.73 TaxID=1314790 RepID=A0A1Y1X5B8_9FUNG|nr:SCP-domain-containing protein [Basidiobolus meristosporus CBS 931.73]ORX80848.1 SCP-domain-containing protein [Basidiobolus meristosporus CBS 931.73]|eukprot:ORX76457.1 SCP-domain-containing protein [Basidiobolus meristosporus CBS 931.73]